MSSRQFNLTTLFLAVTAICALLALLFTSHPFVQIVAGAVIAANVLGAIAALVITHGLGFPRDGSLRNKDPD